MNQKQTSLTYRPGNHAPTLVRVAKLALFFILSSPVSPARAATADPQWEVKTIFGITISSDNALAGYIGAALNGLYSIIGVLTLARILMGAYKYMSAQGDPEAVSEAKDTIRHALTGLVLILLAYTLTTAFLDPSFIGI